MPVDVAVHRLKNFDEWFKLFKSNRPPKVGRWRVMRGIEDRNRVNVVAELTVERRVRSMRGSLPLGADPAFIQYSFQAELTCGGWSGASFCEATR